MKSIDHDTEAAVRRFLSLVGERYDVVGAILYGSRARGSHGKGSDADVAVLLKGEHGKFLPVSWDMGRDAFDVMLETDVLIDPLPIWSDEWEHPEDSWNPELFRNISRDGVRL